MENEFINYTQAVALKELGFNEPCMASDYYADGKILIEYADDGITNTELDKLTDECNEDAAENGDDPIPYNAAIPLYQQAFRWLYYKLDIKDGIMPLDKETQDSLLKELIYKVSSKHLLV